MQTYPKARFVINPAAEAPRVWAPGVHQYVLAHVNPSYLHSLWLGTVWNLYALPYRAVTEVLKPLFHGKVLRTVMSAFTLPLTVAVIFWMGITGRAGAVKITPEQARDSTILDPLQARTAIDLGFTDPVTDLHSLAGRL